MSRRIPSLLAITSLMLGAAGKARLDGDVQVLQRLMACLADFDQYFEIMPGTKPAIAAPTH